jgi:hypothetical protein
VAGEDGSACVYSRSASGGAAGIYCCFDEHELRSAFTVSMRVPAGWSCLANGSVLSRPAEGDAGTWRFSPTAAIPPWLTNVCAGPFCGPTLECERDEGPPLPVTVQTLPSIAGLLEPGRILDLLRQPLRYYEHRLGVPYPYPKCDIVFVPGLPALAYSVPGLIVIHAEVLQSQPDLYVATVIAHELAHAWTGSLVIMRDREDMWLDEALTTYISRVALAEIVPGLMPWEAPTSQTLPDHGYAADAGTIRALEDLIGAEAVVDGLSILLRHHAHGSASRDDLVRCWSEAGRRDLSGWAARALVSPAGELQLDAGAGFESGDGDAGRGGGHGHHPGHQAKAGVVEDRVVDRVAAGGRDRAEVVDHLPRLQPRGADRQQQGRRGILGHRVGVAGVEYLAVDEEAGVGHQRDVGVDERVLTAVDVHVEPGDRQGVAVTHLVYPVAEAAELIAHRPVCPQRKARIGGQRGADRVGVEVIWVFVGDEDRGGACQGRGRVGERARVDDQDRAVLLQPDAGVAELGEPHRGTSRMYEGRPALRWRRGRDGPTLHAES